MCHVVRRSRLGFYAQGRTHHDGLDCHGLLVLSRVFITTASAPPFLAAANAHGLGRFIAARLQIASRRMRLPFGVSKGPATNRSGGVSAGSMSPSEVFAPSVER